MKKILIMCIIAVVAFALVSLSVSADNLSLKVMNMEGNQNCIDLTQDANFEVDVIVNHDKPVLGAAFNLNYDTNVLETVLMTEGSVMHECSSTSYSMVPPNDTGCGNITFQDVCFGGSITKNGTIFKVTFHVKQDINCTNISVTNGELFNTSGYPIGVSNTNLKICKNQPPIAKAVFPTCGYTDEILMFNGNGSYDPDGSIKSYLWAFDDGYFTNITDTWKAHHAYSIPGMYFASLAVRDNCEALSVTFNAPNATCILLSGDVDHNGLVNVYQPIPKFRYPQTSIDANIFFIKDLEPNIENEI